MPRAFQGKYRRHFTRLSARGKRRRLDGTVVRLPSNLPLTEAAVCKGSGCQKALFDHEL